MRFTGEFTLRRRTLLLAGVICSGMLAWLSLPGHLVLDIPVKNHEGGGDFWYETEFAELHFADAAGVDYVTRRRGTAYTDRHGWRTVDEAFLYFDQWFANNGWDLRVDAAGSNEPVLPEADLVAPGQAKCYAHSNDRSPWADRACLAIRPIKSNTVNGFYVVVATTRASLWQRLAAD